MGECGMGIAIPNDVSPGFFGKFESDVLIQCIHCKLSGNLRNKYPVGDANKCNPIPLKLWLTNLTAA